MFDMDPEAAKVFYKEHSGSAREMTVRACMNTYLCDRVRQRASVTLPPFRPPHHLTDPNNPKHKNR